MAYKLSIVTALVGCNNLTLVLCFLFFLYVIPVIPVIPSI